MYKVIFCDIDKTLTTKTGISNKNISFIKSWVQKGNLFILTSGRVISHTRNISESIGASSYIICNNGGIIYDYKNEKVIYKNTISKDCVVRLYNLTNKYNARLIFGGIKKVYTNKLKYPNEEEKINEITDEVYNSIPIAQITISHENIDVIKKIIKEVEEIKDIKILNRHRLLYDSNFKDNGSIWIDIAPINVSKGDAVKKILEYLNLNLEESIRIGDDLNDLSMFFEKGLNVAVENAFDELKQKADYITLSCDNDGVAYLIEKVINNDI